MVFILEDLQSLRLTRLGLNWVAFKCPATRCFVLEAFRIDWVYIQSVTNIFEYSNITNIYSDIPSYQFLRYKYIRTFDCVKLVFTNIFGYSFVSALECEN